MPFVPSKNPPSAVKIPSLSRFQQQMGRVLGDSLRKPKAVRLGNPETGELFVSDDTSLVYISGYGDESDGVSTMPRAGIPREYLKLNQTITVKKQKNAFAYVGIDIDTGGIFNEGLEDQHDQSPISISQLDFATLQPYSAMVAVVKGMIYGDKSVIDLLTADFSASPLDTSSVAINIPTNNNRAIGVLVQLDASAKTLSYKQSAEFNASLSLAQAYDSGLLPLRDAGKWRIGYIRLIAGITSLDNSTIWTCPELFRDSLTGSSGGVNNAVLVADGTSGTQIKATDVLIDSSENMTALNSLAFVASSELTIASGAVTVTSGVHRIDTEANAASDDLDTINGGTTSRLLILYAENTARTVVIRHNGGGTGNIRTFTGTNITLDETYKYLLLMYDATNSVWGVISGGGGTIQGSSGAINNAIITANGTGGSTIQGSGIRIISGALLDATFNVSDNVFRWGNETDVTLNASGVGAAGFNRNIVLKANSGTSDDCIEITGLTSFVGDMIMVRAFTGHTITLKHNDAGATSKILLTSGADYILNATNFLIFKSNTDGNLVQLDAGVSSGAYTKIATSQLGSSQTTITLSSIPATYQDLILVVKGRSTSTGIQINVTFNADTGTNYSSNRTVTNNAGTSTNTTANNATSIACANTVVPSSGTAAYFGFLNLEVSAYAEAAITRSGVWNGSNFISATNILHGRGAFGWENVSNAISSIELNLDAGDFDTGTIYALYGRGTAS